MYVASLYHNYILMKICRSFSCSLVRRLVHSFTRLFGCLSTRSFVLRSFVRTFFLLVCVSAFFHSFDKTGPLQFHRWKYVARVDFSKSRSCLVPQWWWNFQTFPSYFSVSSVASFSVEWASHASHASNGTLSSYSMRSLFIGWRN